MSTRNRMSNLENKYQGNFRRVLCVCSAGMLRSPTAAWVLSNPPFIFNTRAAGLTKEYALIPIDEAMIFWSDDIICFDEQMKRDIEFIIDSSTWKEDFEAPNIFIWKIPDMYDFRSEELIALIKENAVKTYQNHNIIYGSIPNGVTCSHCNCVSPDYEENCVNCGRRLTEV